MVQGPLDTKQVGVYTPETARHVLDVLRQLKTQGFQPKAGVQSPANPNQAQPLYFRNDSGEEMPSYGCMQIVGTVELEGQNYLLADKPRDTTGNAGPFLWNKSVAVEDAGFGVANAGVHVVTRYDSGLTIAAGLHLGPQVDSWEMDRGTLVNACGTTALLPSGGVVARGFLEDDATILCKSPGSGCAARSGTTASQTTCDQYTLNPSSGAMTDSGNNVVVFNIWSTAVGNSVFFTAHKLNGVWVPAAEDCPA